MKAATISSLLSSKDEIQTLQSNISLLRPRTRRFHIFIATSWWSFRARPLARKCWPIQRPSFASSVDCICNVMAHAQKTDFVFWRNGRVYLNRRGRKFSRLLAADVYVSAVVMLDKPCSEVVWRVLATHSIHQFPLHFLSHASPCDITFQLDSTLFSILVITVQQTGSRGVRISGSNVGYTMFRGSVKGTGYLLHSPVSPSLPSRASPCAITFQLDSNNLGRVSSPPSAELYCSCVHHSYFLHQFEMLLSTHYALMAIMNNARFTLYEV
jgi:hypothetical protein